MCQPCPFLSCPTSASQIHFFSKYSQNSWASLRLPTALLHPLTTLLVISYSMVYPQGKIPDLPLFQQVAPWNTFTDPPWSVLENPSIITPAFSCSARAALWTYSPTKHRQDDDYHWVPKQLDWPWCGGKEGGIVGSIFVFGENTKKLFFFPSPGDLLIVLLFEFLVLICFYFLICGSGGATCVFAFLTFMWPENTHVH